MLYYLFNQINLIDCEVKFRFNVNILFGFDNKKLLKILIHEFSLFYSSSSYYSLNYYISGHFFSNSRLFLLIPPAYDEYFPLKSWLVS